MTSGGFLCSFIICFAADGLIMGDDRKNHPVHPVPGLLLRLRLAVETVHSARLRRRRKNPVVVPAVCMNVLTEDNFYLLPKKTNRGYRKATPVIHQSIDTVGVPTFPE